MTISHRPAGSGHPYASTADQRLPVRPVVGEPVWLGAVASPDVEELWCETRCGGVTARVAATRVDSSAEAAGDGAGHLVQAQAAARDLPGVAWQAQIDGPGFGAPVAYRFVADAETTDWFEFAPARWEAAPAGTLAVTTRGTPTPTPSDVEWLTDGTRAHRVRFCLPLGEREHVVGFGERFDALDQRGLTPDSVVFEQYQDQGATRRTYFPMPFAHVVGGDGWGFHVNTSRRVWFDVGATASNRLDVEAEVGEDGCLALSLYAGDPVAVLRAFLDDVGRAEVLPAWVHRLWASGNEWNTQAIVMARADAHRDLDIPVGVVVIEAWSDEETIMIFRDARYDAPHDPYEASDFVYPADGAWPDPAGMIDELHGRDVRVVLWQIPLLKSRETFEVEDQLPGDEVIREGDALVAAGVAVREADGRPYHNRAWWFPKALMADLSTPAGREWWTERRRYLVRDLGVDGFKTDGGEHAWGADLRYNDDTRGDDGNNLNPVRYAKAFGDLLRSCGKAPVTFSRAGFTGSQAHGVFWAGDERSSWAAFRHSVTAGLTAGACGVVYWGWDIGGFSGPLPTPELYIRAASASVFMPIMQYHSEYNYHRLPLRDRTPWNIAEQTGDAGVVDDFRRLAWLRERLVGYVAEQARRAVATDRPLMRSLFFDWPDDETAWRFPLEYMCGDSLLVHPVCEESAMSWSTYLPSGSWVDALTGTAHEGGQVVSSDVSDRCVTPVFCRADDWPTLADVFGGDLADPVNMTTC